MADQDPRPEAPPIEGELLSSDQPDRQSVGQPLPELSLAADLSRAEIDQQIATAHRYPRIVSEVQKNIETLATLDFETAQECVYSLSRKNPDGSKKAIIGPSVRFAEIVLQAWGNCRVASRITNQGKTHLEATGIYHDLQTNMALARSAPVRITTSSGKRYGDDMIGVASAAGVSKALRNAVLAGVPKGVWRKGYEKALAVVAGTAETLERRRFQMVKRISEEFGGTPQEVLLVIGVADLADITVSSMIEVAGLYTALSTGEAKWSTLLAEAKGGPLGGEPAPANKTLAGANGDAPVKKPAAPKKAAPKADPKPEPKAETKTPQEAAGEAVTQDEAADIPGDTDLPAGDAESGPDLENQGDKTEDADGGADQGDSSAMFEGGGEDDDTGTDTDSDIAPEWAAFLSGLSAAEDWAGFRAALHGLATTPYFKSLDADGTNGAYRMAWRAAVQKGVDLPDHRKDPAAFRCWLEAQQDAQTIEDAWFTFASSTAYGKMPQGGRDDLVRAKKARQSAVKGDEQ